MSQWTDGLSTRARNALVDFGFEELWEVADAMRARMLRVTDHRSTVPRLGGKSIDEVRAWLRRQGAELTPYEPHVAAHVARQLGEVLEKRRMARRASEEARAMRACPLQAPSLRDAWVAGWMARGQA